MENMEQEKRQEGREASWLDMEDVIPAGPAKGGESCRIGNGLVLTPFDIFRLARHYSVTPEEWIDRFCDIKIDTKSGIPTVWLVPDKTGYCPFHGKKGCSVCRVRPETCMAFPLERRIVYVCAKGDTWKEVKYAYTGKTSSGADPGKTVKVRKWLDRNRLRRREGFICDWADALCDALLFLKGPGRKIKDPEKLHKVLTMIGRLLYCEYDVYDDFRDQFARNVQEMREELSKWEALVADAEASGDDAGEAPADKG